MSLHSNSAAKNFLRGAGLFILPSLIACSTSAPLMDRFQNLDYDAKSVFLAYYPYLTADQRNDLLDPGKNPRELIEGWAGQFNDPKKQVGSFDEMMNNPANRKITSIEIKTDSPDVIDKGTQIPLHAFAHYVNGTTVEVTPDTAWRVEPKLGEIEDSTLNFECVQSEISLIANFLGEKESTKVIEIRKPLDSLEMKVPESYTGIDTGYNFQLILLAHCQDGTVSDVSCQASWKSVSSGGKISGCGNFVVSSKEKLVQDALNVTASYGNLSIRKTLQPPSR
jgi:hypothetical protein